MRSQFDTEIEGLKILFVEDDPKFREVLSTLIRKLVDPYAQIHPCSTCEEALVMMHRSDYDLIITDLVLSGEKDGVSLWQSCCEQFPKTAMLIISGLGVEQMLAELGTRKNYPNILAKPFHLAELKEIVVTVRENRKPKLSN